MNFFEIAVNQMSELEKDSEIRNMKIFNIPIWAEVRRITAYMFYDLNKTNKKKKRKSNYYSYLSLFNYSLSDFEGDIDSLIVEGHRKKFNKKWYDPLTEQMAIFLDNNDTNYITVERESFAGIFKKKFNSKHYNTLEKNLIRRYYWKRKLLKEKDILMIDELISKIHNQFAVEFINSELLYRLINNFICDYYYYYVIFEKINISNLYLPMSYMDTSVVVAAKDLGIYVSDIQYALFNKYHIGYGINSLIGDERYLPDEYLLWSDYWDKDYLPKVKSKQILKNEILNKKIIKNKKKQILIISQDLIAADMEKLAYQLSDNVSLKGYKIILKQHPWEEKKFSNKITIINDEGIDTQNLINESEVVITSFSTAIYEAIHFGCKVFVYDNGYSYMYDEDFKDILINEKSNLANKINNYIKINLLIFTDTKYEVKKNNKTDIIHLNDEIYYDINKNIKGFSKIKFLF